MQRGWSGQVLPCSGDGTAGGQGTAGATTCTGGGCAAQFEQCASGNSATKRCCNAAHSCVKKNAFFAACLSDVKAAEKVMSESWDGDIVACTSGTGSSPGTYGGVDDGADESKTVQEIVDMIGSQAEGSSAEDDASNLEDDSSVDATDGGASGSNTDGTSTENAAQT